MTKHELMIAKLVRNTQIHFIILFISLNVSVMILKYVINSGPSIHQNIKNGIYHCYFSLQRPIMIIKQGYNKQNRLERKTGNESDERKKTIFLQDSNHTWSNGASCSPRTSTGADFSSMCSSHAHFRVHFYCASGPSTTIPIAGLSEAVKREHRAILSLGHRCTGISSLRQGWAIQQV